MTGSTDRSTDGPHATVPTQSRKEQWLARLWDRLWGTYREKVPYVRQYEALMREHGVPFTNDHIAFRTLAHQNPSTGIHSLARILDAVGYRAAGCYAFEDKHLAAIHFQHPNPGFPKVFVSQLKTWELPEEAREIVARTVASHRQPLGDNVLAQLHRLNDEDDRTHDRLLDDVAAWIEHRPWDPPRRGDVESIERTSQYAAWVLVHGYNVNHYTALINSQHAEAVDSIDKTVAQLREMGVPMKEQVEGEPGSRLRQSATQAAVIDVEIRDGDSVTTMPWTYAYLELAERGDGMDPATGSTTRFEGFLGPQATQLFEMTRKR